MRVPSVSIRFSRLGLLGLLALTASNGRSDPIRVAGSDFLAPVLSTVIEQAAANEGWEIDLNLKGTLLASRAVTHHEADAALVISADSALAMVRASATRVTIAHLAVVVAVSPRNPVESLTMPVLAELFGPGEGGHVVRWEAVGLDGEWGSRTVAPSIVESKAAIDFFRARILGKSAFGRHVERHRSRSDLVDRIVGNSDSIGAIGWGSSDPRVRLLPIASSSGSPAVQPTSETIDRGEYPLAVSLELVFEPESAESMRPLLAVLMSDEAAAALETSGFTPLSSDSRKRLRESFAPP